MDGRLYDNWPDLFHKNNYFGDCRKRRTVFSVNNYVNLRKVKKYPPIVYKIDGSFLFSYCSCRLTVDEDHKTWNGG